MKIIIAGGGKTLYFICRSLTAKGYQVVIIDRDKDECVKLSRQLKAQVICGDGSDSNILEDAEAMHADVLLAITPNDHDNLVICQLASIQFGIPRTLALINDPDNFEIFQKLGISAVSTINVVTSLIEQRVSLEQVISFLPIGEGRVNVSEIIIEENFPVVDQLLKDIELPDNVLIAVIVRENKAIVPRGSTKLQKGDRIVLITLPENHGSSLKLLTGEH